MFAKTLSSVCQSVLHAGLVGGLAIIAGGCSAHSGKGSIVSVITHSAAMCEVGGSYVLPLPIPAAPPGNAAVYRNFVVGVHITYVEVDGVPIEARPHERYYTEFDWSHLSVSGGWHVYQVVMPPVIWGAEKGAAFDLVTVATIGEEYELGFVAYYIPSDAQHMIVRYRPRYSSGDLGGPISVSAERIVPGP